MKIIEIPYRCQVRLQPLSYVRFPLNWYNRVMLFIDGTASSAESE